ncbi:unnamed protein product, partial [Brachionus calyciflorus]
IPFMQSLIRPHFHAFMLKKNEETYREAIEFLKDLAISKNITLNPNRIMADFERASTNAMIYHFPNVIIKGCWFHFRQAIFKRAVKIRLKQFYAKNEYNLIINILGALSLVPIEKIPDAMKIKKEAIPNDPKCVELVDYFNNQWLIKDIQNEIYRFWQSSMSTRKSVTDHDVKLAEKRQMKKIREEETNNIHLEFLERHGN